MFLNILKCYLKCPCSSTEWVARHLEVNVLHLLCRPLWGISMVWKWTRPSHSLPGENLSLSAVVSGEDLSLRTARFWCYYQSVTTVGLCERHPRLPWDHRNHSPNWCGDSTHQQLLAGLALMLGNWELVYTDCTSKGRRAQLQSRLWPVLLPDDWASLPDSQNLADSGIHLHLPSLLFAHWKHLLMHLLACSINLYTLPSTQLLHGGECISKNSSSHMHFWKFAAQPSKDGG